MAQHDYNIANATFPNTRTDINNALLAISSNNSGDSAPSTTFANQWWYETDTNKLYIRNEDNDAWIHILTLNQTNDTVSSLEGASSLAGIDDQSSSNDDQITIKDTEVVINEDSDSINFRVESNGNAHQLFVDGANDRIYVGAGLGASIGSNKFQVQNGGATISSFAADSGSNQLHFIKSRNATVGSRTIVNDGDSVGGIFWKADDGDATDYNNNVAGIEGVIDGTPGTNDTPGRLVFYTTNDGERTNTERMRIDSSGNVGIGETAPLGSLHIKSADTGASVSTNADELVIEGTRSGMTFLAANDNFSYINFGDDGGSDRGTIRYGHSADSFSIQTAAAEAMAISSIGAVTKPLQPAFLATVSTTQSNIADGHVQIVADNEIFDQNADYNTSNYTFTAPVTGKYSFQVNITVSDLAINYQWVYCYIGTSNRTCFVSTIDPRSLATAGAYSLGGAILVDMDANDTALLYFRSSAHGDNTVDIVSNTSNPETYFSGYLVA